VLRPSLTAAAVAAVALVLALPGCGGSSKKSHVAPAGTPSTTTTSARTSSSSTSTSSGGVTSAPGSGNPYGPNSPTEPSGLGRILVKDRLVKPERAKCTATGLLKELSPPEVQALAQNRPSKELKSHVAKAAEACAGGAPSGG
jgi:hypothetical protein